MKMSYTGPVRKLQNVTFSRCGPVLSFMSLLSRIRTLYSIHRRVTSLRRSFHFYGNVQHSIYFTQTNEYIRILSDRVVQVGVTRLGIHDWENITYLELCNEGHPVKPGIPIATFETVKSVVELCSPVSGKILQVNSALAPSNDGKQQQEDIPTGIQLLNEDPEGRGWIYIIQTDTPVSEQAKKFLTPQSYLESFIKKNCGST